MKRLDAPKELLTRLRSQHLHPDRAETDVARVAADICGVQAQDMAAAALQIRARTEGLTAADVERARVEDRTIVRTSAMRGTLHLVPAEDVGWLLALLGPELIRRNQRRFRELGLTDKILERSLDAIREALSEGSLTRPDLARRLARKDIPTEGQAIAHIVYHASLRGLICFGPDEGSKPTYVLLQEWANTSDTLPREAALGKLARRYLAAYGPAAHQDFAAWSGLSSKECRATFETISDSLHEIDADGTRLWISVDHAEWLEASRDSEPIVRLLGAFDTYLLGYASRDSMLSPKYGKRVNTGGGMIRPTLLVDGRIVGTWKMERARSKTLVLVHPFDEVRQDIMSALEQEAADIGRFLESDITLSIAK